MTENLQQKGYCLTDYLVFNAVFQPYNKYMDGAVMCEFVSISARNQRKSINFLLVVF